MQEKIQNIWRLMNADTKKKAIKDVQDAFGNSYHGIRNNWFIKGNVPESYQGRVFLIIKSNLKDQLQKETDEIKKLIK